MTSIQRAGIVEAVESNGRGKRERLKGWGIPRSTYYAWKKAYIEHGIQGLERRIGVKHGQLWNELGDAHRYVVWMYTTALPELSPRLLSVKISDEEDFTVSESTVYRLHRRWGVHRPRPAREYPAAKEWPNKTKRCDEIWQSDGTWFFIPGWGYYKAILVMDDYSRILLACVLKFSETGFTISDAVQVALERAWSLGHTLKDRPKLLSDCGAAYKGKILRDFLRGIGIPQIHGRPYHPQTQGKVERLNRKLKEKICVTVHLSPDKLQAALKRTMDQYNDTPHEALKNVTPNDVYAGRKDEVLRRRAAKKKLTMVRRKQEYLGRAA